MSKYSEIMRIKPKNFKRFLGVSEETLVKMVEVYKAYYINKKQSQGIGGRRGLCPEDRVLLMLGYYREYRTLEHIGFDYGVSEATASRIVREVESVLLGSGEFSLPSKRALYESEIELEYIAIDATESPIQRHKKNKKSIIVAKKSDTL